MAKKSIETRITELEQKIGGSEEGEQQFIDLLYNKINGIESDVNISDIKCSPAFYREFYNSIAKGDTIPEANAKNW